MKAMTFGSLFSGVGGFDLGFARAGMECAWQVEIEPQCGAVLEHHWPGVKRYGDIKDCHGSAFLDSRVREWYTPLNGSEYTEEELTMAGILKKLTPEQAEESVRLYDRGIAIGPIAKFYGVSRQAMWDLLRRRTTMRPQKRFGKDNHFYRGGEAADDHAQNMVEYALRIGVLVRPSSCEECGSIPGEMKDGRTKIQSHHDDYNKPLEVRWLCQECHHQWHKDHCSIKEVMSQELSAVDLMCGGFP